MNRILLLTTILILLIPFISIAEEKPKAQEERLKMYESEQNNLSYIESFAKDLAELHDIIQKINVEMSKYIYPDMQPLSKGTREEIEKICREALFKIEQMRKWYKEDSPVKIAGFSWTIPKEITVYFDIIYRTENE